MAKINWLNDFEISERSSPDVRLNWQALRTLEGFGHFKTFGMVSKAINIARLDYVDQTWAEKGRVWQSAYFHILITSEELAESVI